MSPFDAVVVIAAVYFALSLLCSGLTELVATWRGWRHEGLVRGVRGLVDGTCAVAAAPEGASDRATNHTTDHATNHTTDGTSVPAPAVTAVAVLAQPVVRNLASGLSGRRIRRGQSYLSAESFADAVLDSLQDAAPTAAGWQEAVDALPPDHPLRRPLARFAESGDLDTFRRRLGAWYDESMDRMTGWYARRTRRWVAGSAVVLTVLMNADALALGSALWHQVIGGDQAAFPWGWSGGLAAGSITDQLSRTAGWVITVVAVSFGATFWFDLLSGVVRTRGAGTRPMRTFP